LVIRIASFSVFSSEFATGVSNTWGELTTDDDATGNKFTTGAIDTGGDIFTETYIGRGGTFGIYAASVNVAGC
jgi:hypothetical protein